MGFILTIIITSALGVPFLVGVAIWSAGKKFFKWARKERLLEKTIKALKTAPPKEQPQREVEYDVDYDYHGNEVDASSPKRAETTVESKVPEYTRLDVDEGASADDIAQVLSFYEHDRALGTRASDAQETLRSMKVRERSFWPALDATFKPASISHDKFRLPAEAAFGSILRNSAILANRIQAFDTEGYEHLRQLMQAIPDKVKAGDDVHLQRWKVFLQSLEVLDEIQRSNDHLILELEKLQLEIDTLDEHSASAADESILEEIRRLVDEAKYYR